ncbi:unnamed protein product [Arabidopsis arenosa]|uniref:DUF4283 domain-containing protein n=1 Tax=Arabidopsis arenosa TaxID=38785 RepID=A0A8S2ALA2_ARAAE|nr:unnamed protein product [Arabidopsis arenosa]
MTILSVSKKFFKDVPSPVAQCDPLPEVVNGVARITIPEELFVDAVPLRKSFVVGHFLGDVPHVGTIHATVNRIWTILDKSSQIDVQHIADIPLVVNEWNPETSLAPPDLSAMPMWIDLKGVHGFVFSHKGLEFISRSVGKFVKLHPNTERCFRLDVARLLVEVNLQKPLTEQISFANEKGEEILVSVSYPWLPPKCKLCSHWGHLEKDCSTGEKVKIASKLKDTSVKPVLEKKQEEDRETTATVQELAQNLLRDLEQSSPFQIPVSEKTDMVEEGATKNSPLEEQWITEKRQWKQLLP